MFQETAVLPPQKKSLYEASTQHKNWRYSPAKLAETRASLNVAAVDAVRNAFENDSHGSSSNVSFLTADEEVLLVKHYLSKVPQLCGHFRFPEEVEATAITYIKRFYLKNTVMDWHPKNVMLTALFLATKTTNNPISLETYASNIPKTVPSDVLDLEFLVAQSLGFEFAVWHAHRALWGIWLDIQSMRDMSKLELDQLYEQLLSHVRASRLTDAELLYPPSQIALACVGLVEDDLATQWAHSKSSEAVPAVLDSIKTIISEESVLPDIEMVREVDRRLKLCKNPEKIVGSKAYLAKKAEEEKMAMDKRNKKADEIRQTIEEGDPFGNELASQGVLLDEDDD